MLPCTAAVSGAGRWHSGSGGAAGRTGRRRAGEGDGESRKPGRGERGTSGIEKTKRGGGVCGESRKPGRGEKGMSRASNKVFRDFVTNEMRRKELHLAREAITRKNIPMEKGGKIELYLISRYCYNIIPSN